MTRKRYPDEYRERLVKLAKSGRSYSSLAREFEPSIMTIRRCVEESAGPRHSEGWISPQEYRTLKRQMARSKQERDILAKATTWFAREAKPTVKRSISS